MGVNMHRSSCIIAFVEAVLASEKGVLKGLESTWIQTARPWSAAL